MTRQDPEVGHGELVDPATEPATTAAGAPMPASLVRFVPPQPTPGDLMTDSAARPPFGAGEGPRMPTTAEIVWERYVQGAAETNGEQQ